MSLLSATSSLAGHFANESAMNLARAAVLTSIDKSALTAVIKANLHTVFENLTLNDAGFAVSAGIGADSIAANTIHDLLRGGELRTIFQRVLGREVITEAQEAEAIAVEETLRNSPEVDVRRATETASKLKEEMPELSNVTGTTTAEITNKINKSTLEKLSALYTRAKTTLKVGATIAAAGGIIFVAAEVAEAIAYYIKENQGVIVSTKQTDGTFKTVKFGSRSCTSQTDSKPPNDTTYRLNIHLYLQNVLKAENAAEKKRAEAAINTTITAETIPTILRTPSQVSKLVQHYANSNVSVDATKPCDLVPPTACIAWDVSSPVGSIGYLDPKKLAVNETVTCNANITVLDAMAAIIHRAGVSLVGTANKSLGFDIKWLLIAIAVAFVSYFIFMFARPR